MKTLRGLISVMEAETIQKNAASSKSHTSRGNFLRAAAVGVMTAGIFLSGCNEDKKDDTTLESSAFDGKITATVENGAAYNSTVSKVAVVIYDDENYQSVELASGNYANGSFTITLPATPNAKFLESVEDLEDEGFTVSDKTAKILAAPEFYAYGKNGDMVDRLFYGKRSKTSSTQVSTTDVLYMYADKDVTITGSDNYTNDDYTHIITYNISLKKGWNKVYGTESVNRTKKEIKGELTNKEVSGLKWYFYSDVDFDF